MVIFMKNGRSLCCCFVLVFSFCLQVKNRKLIVATDFFFISIFFVFHLLGQLLLPFRAKQ